MHAFIDAGLMFARILLKQIKETVESSSTDDPKCCLQPYMGKCLDTDEVERDTSAVMGSSGWFRVIDCVQMQLILELGPSIPV
eukprot:115458-Pelagomonas_calceolata.AAC.1